ncbi:MAG: DUF421 domain-containing protein [Desulfobacterales bacterium]
MFFRGDYLTLAMRRVRVTHNEIRAAMRSAGFSTIEEVEAVVLETDGSFNVLKPGAASGTSSLTGVARENR